MEGCMLNVEDDTCIRVHSQSISWGMDPMASSLYYHSLVNDNVEGRAAIPILKKLSAKNSVRQRGNGRLCCFQMSGI
jgi:hypothetical protein